MGRKKRVILDNDFVSYMLRRNSSDASYLCKLIDEMDIEPVVHEYVYENEMLESCLKALVKKGIVEVVRYEDIIKTEAEQEYYEQIFKDLYKFCNDEEYPERCKKVRDFHRAKRNLGEIHSVMLALFMGYEMFLSNDKGAKSLAQNKINTDAFCLQVKNIMDIFEEIALKEIKVYTKKDFLALTKGDPTRKEEIAKIKKVWKGN